MLRELGFSRFAFDGSPENVPSFDVEVDALEEAGIELFAWWAGRRFPEADAIFEIIERRMLKPQIWITGGGPPCRSPQEHRDRVEVELTRIRPFMETSARLGLQVGLYNHGGWFGEPEHQLELIDRLNAEGFLNVGIVYNLHHAHAHLDRLAEILAILRPHLLALSVNGMVPDGEAKGMKILPLSAGSEDVRIFRTIVASGWRGPIGILHHFDGDAKKRLEENLIGLDRLVEHLKLDLAGRVSDTAR